MHLRRKSGWGHAQNTKCRLSMQTVLNARGGGQYDYCMAGRIQQRTAVVPVMISLHVKPMVHKPIYILAWLYCVEWDDAVTGIISLYVLVFAWSTLLYS